MPTITSLHRPIAGQPSEASFPQPTRVVKAASTGMGLPSLRAPEQQAQSSPQPSSANLGQLDTKEETSSKEVTLTPTASSVARMQQKLQREIQDLKAKQTEWVKKEADFIPKSSIKEKLKANAAETLKELGLDYNELTDLLLNQQNTTDPVKKLEAEIENLKSAQEQNVSKQYEATVNQYKSEIASVVSSNDDFVTIREEKAQDVVLQHILDTFNEDGKILTVEEASKDIEDFLVEEALKKASLTKVRAKLSPPIEEKKIQEKTLPPPQKTGLRTLTNTIDRAPNRSTNQFQHLSMNDRIAQAIARAQR